MIVKISNSAAQTQKIAGEIAQEFKNHGGVIALIGDLGSGKTTFTQGFAKALGILDKIISPTFVLIRQHKLPSSERVLFHIDLYRLEQKISIQDLGLKELFESCTLKSGNSIVLIEWAQKIEEFLPKDTTKIRFQKIAGNKRQITYD